jgi:hypothetical protein
VEWRRQELFVPEGVDGGGRRVLLGWRALRGTEAAGGGCVEWRWAGPLPPEGVDDGGRSFTGRQLFGVRRGVRRCRSWGFGQHASISGEELSDLGLVMGMVR